MTHGKPLPSFSANHRARKSRDKNMPQLADAMLCGYGSGLEEEPGTTFEAIP